MNESSHPAPDAQSSEQPAMQRAEAMLDRFGAQVGQAATEAGVQLRRALERAREEAEDMWAEAEHIRRERQR